MNVRAHRQDYSLSLSLLFGGRQVGSLSEVRNGPALEVPRTENGEVFGYK